MKLWGILLIMISCTWFGWQQAATYPRRIRQLRQLQTAFRLLETEITYGLTPLPIALQKVGEQIEPWLQSFFQQVAVKMTEEHLSLPVAWNQAEVCLQQAALSAKDIDLLRSSCCYLGQGDLAAQQKTFALLQQRLQYNLDEALTECQQKQQLWRYLGVSAGAVLVLILL